jgi:RimJ/RimL family protein N-acetyltransferase
MKGLLIDADQEVFEWVHSKFKIYPVPANKAIGVIDHDTGKLIGGVLYQNFNGVNVELSYYGPHSVSASIVRAIARIAVGHFDAARLTVVTSRRNKRLIRGLLKLGFVIEGIQRCFYGHEDNRRNAGVRLAVFRKRLEEVAKIKSEKNNAQSNATQF